MDKLSVWFYVEPFTFQLNRGGANTYCPHSLADPRGAPGTPPGSKFFHFHAVFGKKIKNNSTFRGWRTPLGKILDPPPPLFWFQSHSCSGIGYSQCDYITITAHGCTRRPADKQLLISGCTPGIKCGVHQLCAER